MVVMMDMEISCKGHCEKSSHFQDHVSHTVTDKAYWNRFFYYGDFVIQSYLSSASIQ